MLYGVLASLVSGLLALVSRVQIERSRGMVRVAERLPAGPIIVIANHTSISDGFVLAIVCRRLGRTLRLLATAGVFRAPVVGTLARKVGFIPVARGTDRAADALDVAVAALEAGEAIGLFPEGRITRHGDHWPERARTGAVRLALRTGAPIVPVAIVGAHRVASRRPDLRLLANVVLRPRVRTRVGEAIDVSALVGSDVVDDGSVASQAAVRRATDAVMAILIDLIEEVRDEVAPDPIGVERT